jgi:hypothetical protein
MNSRVQRHPISYEIQFAVKDTGIGIAPDRIDRLLSPLVKSILLLLVNTVERGWLIYW